MNTVGRSWLYDFTIPVEAIPGEVNDNMAHVARSMTMQSMEFVKTGRSKVITINSEAGIQSSTCIHQRQTSEVQGANIYWQFDLLHQHKSSSMH